MVEFQVVEEVFWGKTPHASGRVLFWPWRYRPFLPICVSDPHDKSHKRFFWLTMNEKFCHKVKCSFQSLGTHYHFSLWKLTSWKAEAVSSPSMFTFIMQRSSCPHVQSVILVFWEKWLTAEYQEHLKSSRGRFLLKYSDRCQAAFYLFSLRHWVQCFVR